MEFSFSLEVQLYSPRNCSRKMIGFFRSQVYGCKLEVWKLTRRNPSISDNRIDVLLRGFVFPHLAHEITPIFRYVGSIE
jgi:hypothetical protein